MFSALTKKKNVYVAFLTYLKRAKSYIVIKHINKKTVVYSIQTVQLNHVKN